jgi:hypothetical protein
LILILNIDESDHDELLHLLMNIAAGEVPMKFGFCCLALSAALTTFLVPSQTRAVTFPFTENFDLDRSAWEGFGDNVPLGHSLTGGVNNSGHVFHNSLPTAGQFMGTQGLILFRGNAADSASGGAFTGNWLAGGVTRVQAYVQHDFDEQPIDFFLRITGANPGAGAVLFDVGANAVAATGDNWTLLDFDISEANSTPTSGSFGTVLPNVANFTIGALTANNIALGGIPIQVKLDGVSLVPEPSALLLAFAAGVCGVSWSRRRIR